MPFSENVVIEREMLIVQIGWLGLDSRSASAKRLGHSSDELDECVSSVDYTDGRNNGVVQATLKDHLQRTFCTVPVPLQ